MEACKKANLHEFIISLKEGYETMIGSLYQSLSGGQLQRLSLARAFLHDSPLILLDEPTSNLDSLNEALVLKSLNDNRDGKTIILVSHRPSSLKICDRLIINSCKLAFLQASITSLSLASIPNLILLIIVSLKI